MPHGFRMSLIATLTMNPSLDVTTSVDRVRPTDKLRTGALRHDPGGGGINVARVLHELGGETLAIFPGSGPSAMTIDRLLSERGVPFQLVPIAQQTRESFTVDETSSGEQFRFVLPGPKLAPEEYQACLDALAELPEAPEIVVFSGSLPTGTTPRLPQQVCAWCQKIGAKLIVDMSGPLLREIHGAFLLKPNRRELEMLAGRDLASDDDIIAAARDLISDGVANAVVVSLDKDGAFLVTAGETHKYAPLDVKVESAVGAGDSMVAGIALGLVQGKQLPGAVKIGMVSSAAALVTSGSELVKRSDFERLLVEYQE